MNQKTADALAELWNVVWIHKLSYGHYAALHEGFVYSPEYHYISIVNTKISRRRRIKKVLADSGFELVWEDE